jgi:hypothetical protein
MITQKQIDDAIQDMLAKNLAEQSAREEAKAKQAAKVEKMTAKAKAAAPIPHQAPSKAEPTAPLPATGTIDARTFLTAMLRAGRRLNDRGVLYTNQAEIRPDQVKAIAAFIGYDLSLSHGQQEADARTKANRELNARPIVGPTREEQRQADRTLKGYVAGVADDTAKAETNVAARYALGLVGTPQT